MSVASTRMIILWLIYELFHGGTLSATKKLLLICEISREAENLLFHSRLRHFPQQYSVYITVQPVHIIALLLNACLLGTEHEQ